MSGDEQSLVNRHSQACELKYTVMHVLAIDRRQPHLNASNVDGLHEVDHFDAIHACIYISFGVPTARQIRAGQGNINHRTGRATLTATPYSALGATRGARM
jgi:hypothetical protein